MLGLVAVVASLCGCASPGRAPFIHSKPFDFERDTFSYANELLWEYHYDDAGKWTTKKRQPAPTYSLHCFVVARCARQFFEKARFDPAQPAVDRETYRRLIRAVVGSSPRKCFPAEQQVIIPGYANLRQFSIVEEDLLKEECGGAIQSYFQRGHWRMVLPFSHRHQEETAGQLLTHLRQNHPLVVHLVRFPSLGINHAVVVYSAKETASAIEFAIYDPNQPEKPGLLTFDRASRTFVLPPLAYFPGGKVSVYEIYRNWRF